MALQKQHLQRPGQSHQAEFFAMCQISAQWKRLPACQHASICIAQETSKEKSESYENIQEGFGCASGTLPTN